ncbi:MAG: methyltransferase domain-containing protein [Nocardioidaceae bacterium]|nr:methyltransferase domain-containing protein [Nocardioidaceae bacterium]
MTRDSADASVFDTHLAGWREWQQAPWGRLRYAVVTHVLDRHLRDLGPGLRILDVGGGDGAEAVLFAGRGHQVTLVDYSEQMLEQARQAADRAGVSSRLITVHASADDLPSLGLTGFDVALCHFVIQYVADPAAAVQATADCLPPGGLVSLIAPNPASDVLTKAVRDLDFDGARDLLDAETVTATTFEHEVARIWPATAEGFLADAGCEVVGRYGARMVLDLIADNEPKYDPAVYARIERLELALCDRVPYRDIGRLWQLVARRRG